MGLGIQETNINVFSHDYLPFSTPQYASIVIFGGIFTHMSDLIHMPEALWIPTVSHSNGSINLGIQKRAQSLIQHFQRELPPVQVSASTVKTAQVLAMSSVAYSFLV